MIPENLYLIGTPLPGRSDLGESPGIEAAMHQLNYFNPIKSIIKTFLT
jgi:hypothetical protein